MTDDFIKPDDLFTVKKTKKRINVKQKGNRNELDAAKILSEFFKQKFNRVGVCSGSRTKNTSLTDDAIPYYAGDIICPAKFKYSVECKSGYSDVSLTKINATIDSFIRQAEEDAELANKEPLILMKQDRKPWVCFIKEEFNKCETYIKYKNYYIYDLKELLQKKEDWFVL